MSTSGSPKKRITQYFSARKRLFRDDGDQLSSLTKKLRTADISDGSPWPSPIKVRPVSLSPRSRLRTQIRTPSPSTARRKSSSASKCKTPADYGCKDIKEFLTILGVGTQKPDVPDDVDGDGTSGLATISSIDSPMHEIKVKKEISDEIINRIPPSMRIKSPIGKGRLSSVKKTPPRLTPKKAFPRTPDPKTPARRNINFDEAVKKLNFDFPKFDETKYTGLNKSTLCQVSKQLKLSPIKEVVKDGPAKGISVALLAKVKKSPEELDREKLDREKRIKKLPCLLRIIHCHFVMNPGPVSSQKLVERCLNSYASFYRSSIAPIEVDQQISLMIQLFPDWITQTDIRGVNFVRILDPKKSLLQLEQQLNTLQEEIK
ncbi:uncharacterized protein LOC141855662 [Brevipalpus obovatus]|uniref:uncharacterized protein LOC141855662 n=1 Tax=Brevipalpus obovatus TaxID=246614 RepID=UPI003D9F95CD